MFISWLQFSRLGPLPMRGTWIEEQLKSRQRPCQSVSQSGFLRPQVDRSGEKTAARQSPESQSTYAAAGLRNCVVKILWRKKWSSGYVGNLSRRPASRPERHWGEGDWHLAWNYESSRFLTLCAETKWAVLSFLFISFSTDPDDPVTLLGGRLETLYRKNTLW